MFLYMIDLTGGRPPIQTHRCHPASFVDAEDRDGGQNGGSTQVGRLLFAALHVLTSFSKRER